MSLVALSQKLSLEIYIYNKKVRIKYQSFKNWKVEQTKLEKNKNDFKIKSVTQLINVWKFPVELTSIRERRMNSEQPENVPSDGHKKCMSTSWRDDIYEL